MPSAAISARAAAGYDPSRRSTFEVAIKAAQENVDARRALAKWLKAPCRTGRALLTRLVARHPLAMSERALPLIATPMWHLRSLGPPTL